MGGQLTIGQVAKAVSIPITTVRYYERVGLIEPENRSQSNYRLYSDKSIAALKFIRAAQAIGFKLDDVKTLLDRGDARRTSCADVQSLIKDRLAEIDQRMKDLRHIQRVLKTALAKCREQERAGRCYVIDTLRSQS
jgi:MerR family mercuric resistance operon transcriptional regulator